MKALIHGCIGTFSAYLLPVLCFLLLSDFSAALAADVNAVQDGAKKVSIQRGLKQIAVFTVEIVSDREKMRQGLSGRHHMPDDRGMLFILDSAAENAFWMKGMEFPIDILLFGEDKVLTEVLSKLMPCGKCTIYKTPAHTAYALEINSGLAEALGVKTGDSFVYENK
jgi:uncharacterized membrane protein (UPF0127 family)